VGGGGQRPSIALSADGSILYTADGTADRVSVVEAATGIVLATIATPDQPNSLALSPDESKLFVGINVGTTSDPDSLIVIDTASRSIVGSPIPVGGDGASGIAVSPDGSTLYMAVGNANLVDVIDIATRTVTTLPNGASAQPRIPVLSLDGTRLYVSHFTSPSGTHRITVYDLTGSPVTPVDIVLPSTGSVDGMTMSADGAHLYFTQRNGATVSRLGTIDTATNAVTMLDGIGSGARQVAITPDGTRAYVATAGDSAVAIIDLATNAVVSTSATSASPQDIVISRDGRFAYTSNVTPSSVSRIAIDYAPTISTTSLPGGAVGQSYSAGVTATGFPTPSFSVTGAFPPGLSLDPTTGAISGSPTAAGTYTFTVTASNAVRGVPADADRSITIVITAAAVVASDDGADVDAMLADSGSEMPLAPLGVGTLLLLGAIALIASSVVRRRPPSRG
jgi:YVTN family beta-propeller protein